MWESWLDSMLINFYSNILDTEALTKNDENFIRSLILEQNVPLENVNLTRQVNSILQTQHYELQKVVFLNEGLKGQQRDIELVNN